MLDKKNIILGFQEYYINNDNEEKKAHPHIVMLNNISYDDFCFGFKLQSCRNRSVMERLVNKGKAIEITRSNDDELENGIGLVSNNFLLSVAS